MTEEALSYLSSYQRIPWCGGVRFNLGPILPREPRVVVDAQAPGHQGTS